MCEQIHVAKIIKKLIAHAKFERSSEALVD